MFARELAEASMTDEVRVREINGRVLPDRLSDRNVCRLYKTKRTCWPSFDDALADLSAAGLTMVTDT